MLGKTGDVPMETPRALPKASFRQLLANKISARPVRFYFNIIKCQFLTPFVFQAKEQLETRHIIQNATPSVSEHDASRELAQLKRELHKLKLENSVLFKELDIARRREHRLCALLPSAAARTSQAGESVSSRMRWIRDPELSMETPLDKWLPPFLAHHPEVLAEQEIERTAMKRQFVRDFSSLIRINGSQVEGKTDAERVLAGYFLLQNLCAGKDPEVFKLIPIVATQHLGLLLYEKLMGKYAAPEVGLTVKQGWHHYLDVVLNSTQAQVYLMAVFEAQNLEDETFPTLFIRGHVEIDLIARRVAIEISAPVFDYMQFVAVV